jgi:hypothetical protein
MAASRTRGCSGRLANDRSTKTLAFTPETQPDTATQRYTAANRYGHPRGELGRRYRDLGLHRAGGAHYGRATEAADGVRRRVVVSIGGPCPHPTSSFHARRKVSATDPSLRGLPANWTHAGRRCGSLRIAFPWAISGRPSSSGPRTSSRHNVVLLSAAAVQSDAVLAGIETEDLPRCQPSDDLMAVRPMR